MNRDKFTNKNKESLRDKAGDALENAGKKISNAGSPKIGQKVHDLGDKLERSHTDKDHPEKV